MVQNTVLTFCFLSLILVEFKTLLLIKTGKSKNLANKENKVSKAEKLFILIYIKILFDAARGGMLGCCFEIMKVTCFFFQNSFINKIRKSSIFTN